MSVFGDYARYYDLLYRDKDYAGEAAYLHRLIQTYCTGAKSVLNLGCGSGRHDRELVELGYSVTGVDCSSEMIDCARKNSEYLTTPPDYRCADLCQVRLGRRFDAILALFHVFSYQSSNDSLGKAFATVREHLAPDGICLFDCWYGPAVLTERPEVRQRELEDDRTRVIRHAEPVLYPNDNLVDVYYRIDVLDKLDATCQRLEETHRMRYLFRPEVQLLLEQNGLRIVLFEEWLTGKEPGLDTWSVVFGITF